MPVRYTVAGNLPADDKVRRYVDKTLASLEKFLPRTTNETVTAEVMLDRVDRPHGNKYEATVRLTVDRHAHEATDSTLNIYAALDIVRLALVRQLQNHDDERLPKR